MSGETSARVSGWTVDTLHGHIDVRFDASARECELIRESILDTKKDLQKLLDERYATQTKAVDAAFVAQQTAMKTAFTAADKAVATALAASDKTVQARQDNADREFHEHLEQVRHENALAFVNSDKAINAAFLASDKAITKAELANEKRFESVNEFRAQLSDQANYFMPRSESEAKYTVLEARFQEVRERLALTDQQVLLKVPMDANDKMRFEALARIDGAIDASSAVLKAQIDVLGNRVLELQDRLNRAEGKGQGANAMWLIIAGAVTLLITVILAANAIFR